ncbi:MAG: methionyl-tRNA formyltransferase [Alphaproteobacteria bacterium]|nr:methionyl-tRNA formyltransferase [Alphaproteobacteria bacterium]
MTNSALFVGSKIFGLNVLKLLYETTPQHFSDIVSLDDRDDSRSAFDGFSNFAREMSLDLHLDPTPEHLRSLIERVKPDVMFFCGWYRLIPQTILDFLPLGALGIHHSLLPKYRGGAPLVWAMINGEDEVGSSIFRFTSGMDSGDTLLQVRTSVQVEDSINSVSSRLEAELLAALPKLWIDYVNGRAKSTPQDHAAASYCSQRKPDDGLIDWTLPAAKLHDFIRAQSFPYPGAFTIFKGTRLVIQSASLFEWPCSGVPGQVVLIHDGNVVVACGEQSALRLLKVDFDDQHLPAVSVLNRIGIRLPS